MVDFWIFFNIFKAPSRCVEKYLEKVLYHFEISGVRGTRRDPTLLHSFNFLYFGHV